MNKKERLDLAKWTISYAQKSGADQVAVSLSNKREIEIEFRDKKIEKLKESTQNSIDLRIYAKQRYSGHSTNDLKKASLERFIDEAVASTSYLTKDEYRSLPDPKYYPGKSEMNLEICDQDYGKIESSDRVKMAAEIEKVAMSQSDQIISSTSWYSDVSSQTIKIHSNGFQGESEGTYFQAGAEVTVKDEQRGRPEDYAYAVTRFNKDLPSPEMLGKEAAKRALSKIGQKKIESGQYDMIVENRSVGRLLSMLTQPMSGSALQQKRSFLDGMIGKKIASEKFTIIDDPFLKKGIGSRFFDGDGLATKKRVVIDKGVLRYYFIDDYYGKKLGMEPTTGSPSNILFEDGSESLKELIKHIEKGILVNGFIGGNSNPVTGDFSFGIVGLLIENGKISKPVNEMNISGNAKEFWNRLVALGNDPHLYSSMRSPSMLFEKVHFSGL